MLYRRNVEELGKEGKELVTMAVLESGRRIPKLANHYNEETKQKSVRLWGKETDTLSRCDMDYNFHGLKICKSMFLFLYATSPKVFCNLCDHLKNNGM